MSFFGPSSRDIIFFKTGVISHSAEHQNTASKFTTLQGLQWFPLKDPIAWVCDNLSPVLELEAQEQNNNENKPYNIGENVRRPSDSNKEEVANLHITS